MSDYLTRLEEDASLAQSNFMACAYNAAVNYGSERGRRKMGDLIRAINWHERAQGRVKLQRLVEQGVIDGYKPCPEGCEVRPGGLFHVKGCENDFNHQVSRDRRHRAMEDLPGGVPWGEGWHAASVSLVGVPLDSDGRALSDLGH